MTPQATNERRLPVAILSEMDVLQEAAEALQEQHELKQAMRASEERLRVLRRQFEAVSGYRGMAPHHLEQICRARGLL